MEEYIFSGGYRHKHSQSSKRFLLHKVAEICLEGEGNKIIPWLKSTEAYCLSEHWSIVQRKLAQAKSYELGSRKYGGLGVH